MENVRLLVAEHLVARDGDRDHAAVRLLGGGAGAQINARGDSEPSWSPDGTRIAFTRLVGRNLEVFVMKADGSGQRALTHGSPNHLDPAWSPDGKTIAYSRLAQAHGQTLGGQVYTVPSNGGAQRRLTTGAGGYDELLGWSPDGKQIAFVRGTDLWIAKTDGSKAVRVIGGPGMAGDPAWSPDGRSIAFRSTRDGNTDIYIMNADGSGEPQRLTNAPGDDTTPSWQPIH